MNGNVVADPERIDQFLGKVLGDMGAAISGALVVLGNRLGLYQALSQHGPATAGELAGHTGLHPRYVQEWLAAQAASGFVEYDAEGDRFSILPEQAAVLADPDSPAFLASGFELISSVYIDEPKIAVAFQSGTGVGWHEHHECLFRGTERFFRPGYRANLVQAWLPALDGVVARLEQGATVADVGCGAGVSTIIMAAAFPASHFVGLDYHAQSIARARQAAVEAGSDDNLTFEVAAAKEFAAHDLDLVTCFDCLHDMGDPVGAARHIRQALKPDGTFMLVEPFAHDSLADNLNPIGRMFYSASTMICTPASLSQEVGLGLGAQAGEARLTGILHEAGFRHVRRATETPVNLILEARP